MPGIYSRLGVRTLINATGTLTRLGGSRMAPLGIQPNTIPRAYVEWDEAALGLTVEQALQRLREGEPGVAAWSAPGAPVLNPQVLEPGEERIVAERIRALFTQAGSNWSPRAQVRDADER